MVNLPACQGRIRKSLDRRFRTILKHMQFVLGPEVYELEKKLAAYTGAKHAVTCSSGTDALLLCLMAYDVKPGDAVFTTSFTFFATAESISRLGAVPVFVDIDPVTKNLDPALLEDAILKVKREGKWVPKAVLPVDMFGLPADYDAINHTAKKHGLVVIEDAAQSFGAVSRGRKAGNLADVAATSFFPSKPLGAYGDGGAVFTNDTEIAGKLIALRNHGIGEHRYHHIYVGLNARLDSFQAAVLLSKLEVFDSEMIARRRIAKQYDKGLKGIVDIPALPAGVECAWAQYSVAAPGREQLQTALRSLGVQTVVYYPIPMHLQPIYTGLGYKAGDLPHCEKISDTILSLPMKPYLSGQDIKRVIDAVRKSIL